MAVCISGNTYQDCSNSHGLILVPYRNYKLRAASTATKRCGITQRNRRGMHTCPERPELFFLLIYAVVTEKIGVQFCFNIVKHNWS